MAANKEKSATSTKGTVKDLKVKMDRKAIQQAMATEGKERADKVLACLNENNCRISSIVVMRDGQEIERRYEIIPNFEM